MLDRNNFWGSSSILPVSAKSKYWDGDSDSEQYGGYLGGADACIGMVLWIPTLGMDQVHAFPKKQKGKATYKLNSRHLS